MADDLPLLRVDTPIAGVRRLTLDRPARRNALNVALRQALCAAIGAACDDDDIQVLVIAGGGAAFSAGTDLREASELPAEQRRFSYQALWAQIEYCEKPVIAAIEGAAIGAGFELALSCDMIIAADTATFALPEVKFGFIPGGGGTQRLIRQVGKYQAMRLILAAEEFSAAEAASLGLLSRRVAAGQAVASALDLATTIASMPQAAVRRAKTLLKLGREMPLPQALAFEAELLGELNGGAGQVARTTAFTRGNR